METLLSGAPKVQLSDYIITNGLNQTMQDTLLDYLVSLHVSELSKEQYLCRLRKFGLWLRESGLRSFAEARKAHINRFLAMYKKNNTKNGYLTTLIPFYRDFLNKTEVIKGLNYYNEELEPITPSDVLTPDEVVKIARARARHRLFIRDNRQNK